MATKQQKTPNRKPARKTTKKADPGTLTVVLSPEVAYACRVGAAVDEKEIHEWIEWALCTSASAGMESREGEIEQMPEESQGAGVKIK